MTTDLYLIRHGEAVANVEPIIGGMQGDTGLTDRGRRQAKLLGERLPADDLRADQPFVSTLPRALATLVRRHEDETVVAVCHGGVLEASFFLAFGIGGTGTRVGFAPLNTSITHWRYERDENFHEKW